MKHQHNNTNANLRQLSSETLIVGVDLAKRTHVARFIDNAGLELSTTLLFQNNTLGFNEFARNIRLLKTMYHKTDVIVGVEPTGPYGLTLIQYLKTNKIKVVLVLGQKVSAAKQLNDNTPSKNDAKDALTIACLIRDGRFNKSRDFNQEITELKEYIDIHTQLTKDLTRFKCRIGNWLVKFFPEFTQVFKDWTQKTAYTTLKSFPLPNDVEALSEAEIIKKWREGGTLRSVGIQKARALKWHAHFSSGLIDRPDGARKHIRILLDQYETCLKELEDLWTLIESLITDIPVCETLLSIPHMAKKAAAGIAAELGDVADFTHPKQLSRLAGLSLKESSSGGRRGISEITKRGRPHLRRWLYIAVLGMLKDKEPAFWALHMYYTKREKNPLKPMQSVMALCNKLLRVIWGVVVKGTTYDSARLTEGIPAITAI